MKENLSIFGQKCGILEELAAACEYVCTMHATDCSSSQQWWYSILHCCVELEKKITLMFSCLFLFYIMYHINQGDNNLFQIAGSFSVGRDRSYKGHR